MDSVFSRSTQPDNLPDETLAALLKAARGAKPGPYIMAVGGSQMGDGEDDYYVHAGPGQDLLATDAPQYNIAPDRDTMALFVLCDPDTIRSLVTELAVLRKLNRG